MPDARSIDYINSTEYQILSDKVKELKSVCDDLSTKLEAARKLRYADVDIEAEREAGTLQPDELYVPLHIIDTNIRREQSPYVQYVTQSTRAVICHDRLDSSVDLSLLEEDLTKKLRYEGWQLPIFANIDSFQANGYSVLEVVQDLSKEAGISIEHVPYGDFAFITDTKDIQSVEMCGRAYYFTRTKLIALCGDNPEEDFDRLQIDKVIAKDPEGSQSTTVADLKDKSLYKIYKVMFRVNGIVHVAWAHSDYCDDWIRKPRPLFLGRRKLLNQTIPQRIGASLQSMVSGQPNLPTSVEDYEKNYPYVLFPYLISENDTISQLKGRVFLDQDLQEAASSLLSSTITKARRSAGIYFSKDVSDPNDDLLLQKNIFFRSGCLINAKVQEFQLQPPDPTMFNAVQMLMTANQNETSQVSFATNNRKDSRKTAEEIKTAAQEQAVLSIIQVVLSSISYTQLYRIETDIIVSRVKAGLIQIPNPAIRQQYDRDFIVKPAGDVDVIEKQQQLKAMMDAWPVVQKTPLADIFFADIITLMFPIRAPKYLKVLQEAKIQQQSQQQQQMQQFMQQLMQFGNGLVQLSGHPEFFSESGKIHAYPVIQMAAQQVQQLMQQKK